MRTTSALYKQLRSLPGSHYQVKVVRGNTTYGMDKLKSVLVSNDLFMDSGLSIGNTCSSHCELKLIETSENWPRMAQFEIQVQLLSEDETQASEWLSMGQFFTDERRYESGTLSISAYDAMLKADTSWTDKITAPSSWPITAKSWCDRIQSAGLFQFDSRSIIDNTVSFIGLNTDSTIRDKLKDIAAAHGANWLVTPEGKLRLVPFSNEVITDSAIAGIAVAGIAIASLDNNIIPYPYYWSDSITYQGVTITVNQDGSITLDGTATGTGWPTAIIWKTMGMNLDVGSYLLVRGNTEEAPVHVELYAPGATAYFAHTTGEPTSFVLGEGIDNVIVYLKIAQSGYTFDNYTIYPRIIQSVSNYFNVGKNMRYFNRSTPLTAVTGISLETDSGIEEFFGNETGYVVSGVCNFTNNTPAGLCYGALNGYVYRPFNAGTVRLDPAAELGDLIGFENTLYQIMSCHWNLNNMPTADLSAPFEEEIDHEYEYESDEARTYQKVVRDSSVNNLLPYPYYLSNGASRNGITATINNDGSITLDTDGAAASGGTAFYLSNHNIDGLLEFNQGTYSLTCQGSSTKAYFCVNNKYEAGGNTYSNTLATTKNGPSTFMINSENKTTVYFYLHVDSGTVLDHVMFYPQIETGAVPHAWESPVQSFASLIQQNADQILLKVTQGEVASELSIECTEGVGYVNVGTDRFTIDSTNFKLDRNGNVTTKGSFTAGTSETRETAVYSGLIEFRKSAERVLYMYGNSMDITNMSTGTVLGTVTGCAIKYGNNGDGLMIDVKSNQVSGGNTYVLFNQSAGAAIPAQYTDTIGTWFQGQVDFANPVFMENALYFAPRSEVLSGTQNCKISLYTGYLPNDTNYTGYGEYINLIGGLCVNNGLYVYGVKYRVVETEDYGDTCLSAVESADPLFSDVGSGVIDEDGKCYVFFDPVFAETVNLNYEYHVFTTQTSEGAVNWVKKDTDYFIVHGEPGTTFDWIAYAKQKDFENARLSQVVMGQEVPEKEYAYPLDKAYPNANETEQYMEELETDYDQLAEQYLQLYEEEIEDYGY